ncbi:MAG: FkbM family methyltransferase, partial [Acidobacteriota bacterium]
MILLAGLYLDTSAQRLGEFLTCIERNAANRSIEEVHVFIEDSVTPEELVARHPQLASPKIRLVSHGKRVTYRELFAYANRALPGRRVIVANTDIFFDHSLARLDDYRLAGRLLCLSRWDLQGDGSWRLFDFENSQDAWIFETPLPDFDCDFHLGLLGCDNRLAFEAARAGLVLTNPSRSIHAYHLHASGVRRYTESQRLHGPTRGVKPEALDAAAFPRRAAASTTRVDSMTTFDPSATVFALTSLSPSEQSIEVQRRSLESWREAGLHVRSFNHPSEIPTLAARYDVELVPVERTGLPVFGRHFIPINRMLEWAAAHDVTALVINSDIELRLAPWEMQRIRRLAEGGLCYFIRHNHDGNLAQASREPYGIDAFLLSGRNAGLIGESFLSMGQPFWDYWLPHMFAVKNLPLLCVDSPAAFHRRHVQRWSWEDWHRCGLEFARVTHQPDALETLESCVAMAARIRDQIDRARTLVTAQPFAIREWVEKRFRNAQPKTFLELGAHRGTDTAWMAQIPGVTLHAFEPDPRNDQPTRPNVTLHRAAIADVDGRSGFVLSAAGWGQVWTHSSSLKRPKHHLTRYPVTFGETIEVETVALDSAARRLGLDTVDFIWADIQGAEGEMVRGGLDLLRRTRYLFTEYSDDELYEGQSTLAELLALLPDYRVLELWSDDVLLENRAFSEERQAMEATA